MTEVVHSSFSEVRACTLTYTHNNPDRRDEIRSALQDIIQRELPTCHIRADPASRSISPQTRSELAQAEVAKELKEDATTSTSNNNQANFNSHEKRPQRRDGEEEIEYIREKYISDEAPKCASRCSLQDTEAKESSPNRATLPIKGRRRIKRAATQTRSQNTLCLEGPSTIFSRSQAVDRTKRRKLRSGKAGLSSYIKSPKGRTFDPFAERQDSHMSSPKKDGSTTQVTRLPLDITDKICRIRSKQVLTELQGTLSTLRCRSSPDYRNLIQTPAISSTNIVADWPHKLDVPRGLAILRGTLEAAEIGQQIWKLRKRAALAQFYNVYTWAQAHAHDFLTPESGPARIDSSRRATKVQSRFIDLTFPSTISSDPVETTDSAMKRAHQQAARRAAIRKRFGAGILLLLPSDFSDENLRTLTTAGLHEFLTQLDHVFPASSKLSVETTALAESLLKGQAPPKKLRLENDLMCSEGTGKGDMQDLEALFEPYEELALSSGGVIPPIQAVSQPSPTVIPAPLPFPALSPQVIARRNDPAAADGEISPHVLPRASEGLPLSANHHNASTPRSSIYPSPLASPGFFNDALNATLMGHL